MKRFTIILVVSVCLLLIAAYPRGGSASSNPFSGNWRAIDDADGSNLKMRIVEEARSGGKVFNVHQTDDRTGPWCGGGPAEMNAVGVLQGENKIEAQLVWWCLDTSQNPLAFVPDTLTYDPTTGTIIESFLTYTNIYSRIR